MGDAGAATGAIADHLRRDVPKGAAIKKAAGRAEACRLPQPAHWAAEANTALSEIDADGDVAAHQLGNGSCICQQLREFWVSLSQTYWLAVDRESGDADLQ
jgi:hypothetical protein